MRSVRFSLGARSYDAFVGAGLLDRADTVITASPLANAAAFAVVADRAVGPAIARLTAALARTDKPVHEIVLDVSESSKSMRGLDDLYGRFLDAGLDRNGVVVALGGGVVGDLAGYAAATYQRGVRWIGAPTTLLAAVDSSVGGKTAINHARGKNLIGAIHQPALVLVDPTVFATLPRRDRISGYGEMIKYGLALDAPLWAELSTLDADAVTEAHIERCLALKAAIVAADEHDVDGVRERLNFGHTIGHALEAATDYAYFRHGEAVVIGMRAAVWLSAARGHCRGATAETIDALLARVDVPALPPLDRRRVVAAIARDKKKAADGATRFVLLRTIGETVADAGVDREAVGAALDFLERACASRS